MSPLKTTPLFILPLFSHAPLYTSPPPAYPFFPSPSSYVPSPRAQVEKEEEDITKELVSPFGEELTVRIQILHIICFRIYCI